MSAEPVRIAVMGSCITRDNFNSRFNPGYKAMYETVLMQNQSSLISLMAPPYPLTAEQIGPGTDYDKWNVATDTSKEFLTELADLRPAYLILDFFGDVHFGVVEAAPGHWVTDNRWKLWPTPFYQQLKAAGPLRTLRIERDTETYLDLWRDAFDRFLAHVRHVAPQTVVIVHRGHNASLLQRPGESAPVSLQDNTKLAKIDIGRLNELWAVLDDYAVTASQAEVIDLTGQTYPSPADHPWGPYYVHYAMDYYADFLAALNEIHLRRTAGPRDHAMLIQLLERRAAASQHARDRVTELESELAAQRRKLRTVKKKVATLQAQAQVPARVAAVGSLERVARGLRRRLRPGAGKS